ncbi:hypothetical protein IUY40_18835 [Flavobacterium sp. ALJ2]|uniref:hypothetical protein n=1 Tax=Flavobacterium sp. ALJ2 TaxID=2786960 RepID=UPI0018A07DC9|nr:hypothetical protein [Flavobacterium sp. ALJ2]MBF7093591.1 hypothetical protein [Flavobacterium sp. ALJ2]
MAKKQIVKTYDLPKDTIIEVVSIKGNQVVKQKMPYGSAMEIKTNKGGKNIFYQLGFCSTQESKSIKPR